MYFVWWTLAWVPVVVCVAKLNLGAALVFFAAKQRRTGALARALAYAAAQYLRLPWLFVLVDERPLLLLLAYYPPAYIVALAAYNRKLTPLPLVDLFFFFYLGPRAWPALHGALGLIDDVSCMLASEIVN